MLENLINCFHSDSVCQSFKTAQSLVSHKSNGTYFEIDFLFRDLGDVYLSHLAEAISRSNYSWIISTNLNKKHTVRISIA